MSNTNVRGNACRENNNCARIKWASGCNFTNTFIIAIINIAINIRIPFVSFLLRHVAGHIVFMVYNLLIDNQIIITKIFSFRFVPTEPKIKPYFCFICFAHCAPPKLSIKLNDISYFEKYICPGVVMQANESIYDFDALDALDYNADDWDKIAK